jgi:hypothetical protein
MGDPIKAGIIAAGAAHGSMTGHWAYTGMPGMVWNRIANKAETRVLKKKLNRSSQRLIPVVGAAGSWFMYPGEVDHEIFVSICSKRGVDFSVDKI